MIVENCITVFGMRILVSRTRCRGGYSAELLFEGGDRAVVDAASMEELEGMIDAVAFPAVVARRAARRAALTGAASPPAAFVRSSGAAWS